MLQYQTPQDAPLGEALILGVIFVHHWRLSARVWDILHIHILFCDLVCWTLEAKGQSSKQQAAVQGSDNALQS